MAVTYAWRLDANKYSYIVSPSGEDGYISPSPLQGSDLAAVASIAENKFGSSATNGFTAYKTAFTKMTELIENEWGTVDLLSADVYYNVDSADCADLRGVGIKNIMYMGAIPRTKENMNGIDDISSEVWNIQIPQGQPGTYSVFGVFMDDQEIRYDENGNILTAPHNIFIISNAFDAPDSENIIETFITRNEYEEDLRGIDNSIKTIDVKTTAVNSGLTILMNLYNGLNQEVDDLKNYKSEDGIKETLSSLEERVGNLEKMLADYGKVLERLTNLEDEMNKIKAEISTPEIVKATDDDDPQDKYILLYSPNIANPEKGGSLYYSNSIKVQYNNNDEPEVYSTYGFFESDN